MMPRLQPKPLLWSEAPRTYRGALHNAQELGGISLFDATELAQDITHWIPHTEGTSDYWTSRIYTELQCGQGFIYGNYGNPTGYVSAAPILVLEAAQRGKEVIWVTKVLTAPGTEATFAALLEEASNRFPEAYLAFMHYDSLVLDQAFALGFTYSGNDPLVLETSIHIQNLLRLRSLPLPLPPNAASCVQVLVRPPVET